MTLSRSRPMPSHDWPEGYDAGPPQTCETCGTEWREGFDSPPPWKCKRSGLETKVGLQPGRPPRRKTRLKAYSTTNSGGPETFGPLADYARSLGCAVRHHEDHVCQGEVQAHHVRSRGAGHGDRTRAGHGNVVGLCWRAHHEIHTDGMHTFERRYSINLKARAHSIGEEFERAGASR